MKKTLTIILTLMLAIAITVSTSGCINTGPIATEKHKQLMLSLLKEKYGEEFKVLTIKYDSSSGFSGGLAPGSGHYDAVCCPKSNEEILFEASVCKNGTMISSDDYPHAVVKHLVKEEVEKVISKYSDNYAVYVYMSKPDNMPNDTKTYEYLKSVIPFTKASDISIKSYNEKYLQTYFASIDIVLCDEKYKSVEAIQKILDDNFKSSLYEMRTVFDFYFASNDKVDGIKSILSNSGITPDNQYYNDINAINYHIIFHYNQETNYTFIYSDNLSKLS